MVKNFRFFYIFLVLKLCPPKVHPYTPSNHTTCFCGNAGIENSNLLELCLMNCSHINNISHLSVEQEYCLGAAIQYPFVTIVPFEWHQSPSYSCRKLYSLLTVWLSHWKMAHSSGTGMVFIMEGLQENSLLIERS